MTLNGVSQAAVAEAGPFVGLSPKKSAPAPEARTPSPGGPRTQFWLSLSAVVALGALGLSPVLIGLWQTWTTDPLRSIGMLIVPAGVLLTLNEWREAGWELRGTWWGLLPLLVAFFSAESQLRFAWIVILGQSELNLLSPGLALYLFATGAILLFAGTRVWRRAWLPLGLLIFAQPVPAFGSRYLDLPLQSISAHMARAFANAIGFPPSNPQLLRLMFAPDFGMFIAPGCDGLRGAVTLGYAALIVGHLKRVSIPRWLSYVIGAVLLGYLFNFLRLCMLVLYYRMALGHSLLQRVAKQADYAIGGFLMLIAASLFLWIVLRKAENPSPEFNPPLPGASTCSRDPGAQIPRMIAFALIAGLSAVGGVLAIHDYQKSLAESVQDGDLTALQLDDLMPKQIGGYKLTRAWQQEANGRIALETGAYRDASSNEVILGVWLPPGQHSLRQSWQTHGEDPQMQETMTFTTAHGAVSSFATAFYSDELEDSLAGDVICTPTACLPVSRERGFHLRFTTHPIDFKTRGRRAVPIFFRIETPHERAPAANSFAELNREAQQFVANLDLQELSRRYQ